VKTGDWVLIGIVAIAGYFIWVSGSAGSLQWIVQGVGIGANGLTTELNLTMLVQNPSSATITVSNMLVSCSYNGTVIGTGVVACTVPPGNSNVPISIVCSDITIIANVISDVTNGGSGSVIVLSGKGVVNGLPATFTSNYTLP
jgi:LEA14-like dessication related protein